MSKNPSLPSQGKAPQSSIMQKAGYRETSTTKYAGSRELDSEKRFQGVAQDPRGSAHPMRAAPRKESQAEEDNPNPKPRYSSSRTEYEKPQQKRFEPEETSQAYQLKIQRLERDLKDCQDEIFSLQPPRQVQEYEIINGWVDLCNSIDTWVDEDGGLMDEIGELSKRNGRDMLLHPIVNQLMDLEGQYRTVSRNPSILDDALRHVVFEFLFANIFSEKIGILGLTSAEKALVDTVERSLGDMEPRRGKWYELSDWS